MWSRASRARLAGTRAWRPVGKSLSRSGRDGSPQRTVHRAPICCEARLDVVAWSPSAGIRDLYIDGTVRHAPSARYRAKAAIEDGAATLQAAAEKKRRYPLSGGLACCTASAETMGRLGAEFRELFQELAQMAAARADERGLPAKRWARRWRVELSCQLHKAVARSMHEAIVGSGI